MSEGVGARLVEERLRLGLTQTAFAELGGVKKGSQIAYEKGETSPSAEYLLKLSVHEVDAGYVLTGHRVAHESGAPDEGVETVEVQEIDLAYGLGGTFADGPIEVTHHRFPRAFIESITSTPPQHLFIARGRGDSMQPTMQDGDLVLIDRSQRTIREQDAIWALTIGDIAMIKRIRARGERVMILSDNDRIPPDDVFHEEVNVVGRVIFIGRRV